LLAQWSKWNLRQKWMGEDGFDYMNGLAKIKIPALILAGGTDDIAPVSGCKKLYEALGSEDKTWLVCSIANSFSKDFTHCELIHGEAAKNGIFPQVGQWLMKRNSILKDSKLPNKKTGKKAQQSPTSLGGISNQQTVPGVGPNYQPWKLNGGPRKCKGNY